jgi:hypothetical protein
MKYGVWLLAAAVLAGALAWGLWGNRAQVAAPGAAPAKPAGAGSAAVKGADPVGPKAPGAAATGSSGGAAQAGDGKTPTATLPQTPAVADVATAVSPTANANVRSVVEAAKTGKHPERLTAMLMPKAFDKAAFEANPQAYLDVVEPGRVWQTAKGAPNVKTLDTPGPAMLDCLKNGSVTLTVVGEKLAPVTFTSFDMGAFQNRLTSVTVRADDKGAASAVFTATPGTTAGVNIIAASPLAVGQVKFLVTVKE